jgi:tripartite-type tricarboxylate transporter receptor subunit TctC
MAAFVRSGKVRGLAVSGAKRSAVFPDLPTLNESGVPGYDVTSWSGLVAPTGVPRAIVDRLNTEVNKAINSAAYKDKFEALGSEGGGGTPEAFADLIRKDSAKWADVIKRSGAKID